MSMPLSAVSGSIPLQIVRPAEAQRITGLPRSVFYAKQKINDHLYDPTFPKSVKLGARARGYILQELQSWIEARMLERTSALNSVVGGGAN
ncbi:helix-turn-helix transcriptional regulator [Chitinibacter sp. S2-10]|uniref:helix-turn-helix transcriptional regulator n=1 Tax=Chitinibacter sp. S2-10 TaxID=3373597 RepID=UPI0039778D9D